MIYAYDLIINLNNNTYDYYDWIDSDKLMHIRRVPLFKVNNKTYKDISFRNVKSSSNVLNMIKDKTQVFTIKALETIEEAMIITNGINAMFIYMDNKGNIISRSKFLVNEELEIIELSNKMKEVKLDYKINDKNVIFNSMTREEEKTINLITNLISKIKNEKEKIDYIYFEWFKEFNTDYDKLISDIKRKYTLKHKELLDTLNLLIRS